MKHEMGYKMKYNTPHDHPECLLLDRKMGSLARSSARNRWHMLAWLTAACAMVLSMGSVASSAEPIGLEALVNHAKKNAPEIKSARDDVRVAQHRLGSAVAKNLPRVISSNRLTYRYNNPAQYSYSFNYDGTQCTDPANDGCIPFVVIDEQVTAPEDVYSLSTGITALQPIFSPKNVLGAFQAVEGKKLAGLKVQGTEEQLTMDLLQKYAHLQSYLREEAIYQRGYVLATEMEKVTRAKRQTGEATDLDVDQAALDSERAASHRDSLPSQRAIAAAQMNNDSGLPPDQVLKVCLLSGTPDDGGPLQVETSTRIKTQERRVAIEKLDQLGTKADFLPTINAVGGLTYSASGQDFSTLKEDYKFDSWYVGGSLSWTLFDGLGRYHGNRATALELARTKRDLESERISLRLDDKQTAQQLQSLTTQRELLERTVALSERESKAMVERFKVGNATYDMVYQSFRKLEGQRLELTALIEQQWTLTAFRLVRVSHAEEAIQRFVDGQDGTSCAEVRTTTGESP